MIHDKQNNHKTIHQITKYQLRPPTIKQVNTATYKRYSTIIDYKLTTYLHAMHTYHALNQTHSFPI